MLNAPGDLDGPRISGARAVLPGVGGELLFIAPQGRHRAMLHKGRKIALHTRGVTQIAFKPDWTPDGKAAPSKRNDRMLDIVPTGVVVFPGSGITGNLADKARKLGIPVLDHRGGA